MKVFRLLSGRQGWVAVMVVILTAVCGVGVTFLSVMDLSVTPPDPILVACYGDDPNSILPNDFANFLNFQSETNFVVCVGEQQETVLLETCHYEGLVVERYGYEIEMWLVNQDTGTETARGMVRGAEPLSCDESAALATQQGQSGVAVQGEPVSAPEIEAWLLPYFPDEIGDAAVEE